METLQLINTLISVIIIVGFLLILSIIISYLFIKEKINDTKYEIFEKIREKPK